MRFELFISLRYLLSRRDQKFISVISWVAVVGVALGVSALIVVMGVMNGFTTDLRDKIIGATSHSIIFDGSGNFRPSNELLEKIRSVPGITGAAPFIYSELMLSSSAGGKGIILRGIDPESGAKTLGVLKKIIQGSVEALNVNDPLPGIIVGKELAYRLGLAVGSRVNMIAPSGQQSAAGYTPKIKAFRVAAVFSIGMYEYDSSLAFVTLPAARDILGWPDDVVSGVELAVKDVDKAVEITNSVIEKIGVPYYGQTWMDMNANLFAALKLEKVAMSIILFLVVVVGAFSIVTALVMLVMEKTRDIAILMSMGTTKKSIRMLFTLQGLIIGILGTVLGFILGLTACFLLQKYQFIKLPKGVYSLDYLPVLLNWPDLTITAVAAIIICLLATLYPSSQAANLEPVDALRHE